MFFYQRLRDLREDADKTQKEIASYLNTSQVQYQRYESGKREIPFHMVINLTEYYNVSIDYIAGLTNLKSGKNNLSEDEKDFLEKFNRINERNKGKLDYFINTILRNQRLRK